MVDDRFFDKIADFELIKKHRDPNKEDLAMTRAALAMCENIDWNVGRLLKKLDELKLRVNTIVVYFCDNGPNSFRWNGGMKGRKGAAAPTAQSASTAGGDSSTSGAARKRTPLKRRGNKR